MKNLAVFLGLFLSMNAFSQIISDVTVVKVSTTVEGGRAEDLYDALSDIHEPICNEEGCQQQTASITTCTRMMSPIRMDTCTVPFESKNEKNETVIHFVNALGSHAEDLADAIIAINKPECTGEAGFETCMASIKRISCSKTGPWYWRSYECTLEL